MYMLNTNILVRAIRHPEDPICSRIYQEYGGNLCISSITYADLLEYKFNCASTIDWRPVFGYNYGKAMGRIII